MHQEPQFVLKRVDMPEEYVEDLKTVVKEAFKPPANDPSNTPNEREIAQAIKKHFDHEYGPIWHCVVGKSFGAFGTHETKHFVYLYYGEFAIQLWKCGCTSEDETKDSEKEKDKENDK